jgi:hypothetical protein
MEKCELIHKHVQAHTYTQSYTCAHTDMHMQADTHMYTGTHTRMHTQAHEIDLKSMEARMLEAQDGIIKRTVTLMETKAAAFDRAVQVCVCVRVCACLFCVYQMIRSCSGMGVIIGMGVRGAEHQDCRDVCTFMP